MAETAEDKNLMKKEAPLFDRLQALIDGHQAFIITTHVVPDGDGLGGEIALGAYLKQLGKSYQIVNMDPTPEKFALVDPDEEAQVWKPGMELLKAEIIFAVDVNDESRIGPVLAELKKQGGKLIFIDHHILDVPNDDHIIDEQISSMGEFFYRFFAHVNAEVNFKEALAMYVSIITDTKQFRHRKTTALSHAIAASLVETGVDPAQVHHIVHQTRALEEMHFLGEALRDIKTTSDHKIVWMEITEAMQKRYEASPEESQGFADHLMFIKGAEVGILFREEGPNKIKISFRSKGNIEIYPTVKELGGGGHAYESGTLLLCSMEEAVSTVLSRVKKLF